MTTDCGADIAANQSFLDLLDGADFTLPVIPDLTGINFTLPDPTAFQVPVHKLTNADLTTKKVDGDGTFDTIMSGLRAHLQLEFEKGRITGEQYAKTYVALTESAMSQSVQYLLQRESAYWQAITAQQQALAAQAAVITARVQLETAKVQLFSIRAEALTNQANYALTKMKLAGEGLAYCIAKFNLEEMLPVQLVTAREQMEAARSQTLNTRSDGITTIAGSIGKQKDLYTQQITSYQRDSEVKAAKIFSDAWITMKTIDEGLLPPDNFNNASLNVILATLKLNNSLS